ARRHRRRRTAPQTPEPAISQPPPTRLPAARTHEPFRPTKPLQIIHAVSVGAEPRTQLTQRPRVITARQRHRNHRRRTYRQSGPLKWIPPSCLKLRERLLQLHHRSEEVAELFDAL